MKMNFCVTFQFCFSFVAILHFFMGPCRGENAKNNGVIDHTKCRYDCVKQGLSQNGDERE